MEGKLEAPKHLARTVHDLDFEPEYEEFRSRTIWSLSNAFTPMFKQLEPILQFRATAKLGEFLDARSSQSFWLEGVGIRRPSSLSQRVTSHLTGVLACELSKAWPRWMDLQNV